METLTAQTVHLGPGWTAFTDPSSWLRYGTILLLATASGLLLAYHPVHRGRPLHIADAEQRKTLIIYSTIGALIALVCATTPSMAFVIFGIGGLMRFRTDLGASKHTGHTMMATLIGLCWGLDLQLVAAFATLYFWLMIYVLERAQLHELTVGGVAIADMGRAADAYKSAIEKAGGTVTAHNKRFKKQEMIFVFRLGGDRELAQVANETSSIPKDLQGTAHFPDN